jgi:hypothetical protein
VEIIFILKKNKPCNTDRKQGFKGTENKQRIVEINSIIGNLGQQFQT